MIPILIKDSRWQLITIVEICVLDLCRAKKCSLTAPKIQNDRILEWTASLFSMPEGHLVNFTRSHPSLAVFTVGPQRKSSSAIFTVGLVPHCSVSLFMRTLRDQSAPAFSDIIARLIARTPRSPHHSHSSLTSSLASSVAPSLAFQVRVIALGFLLAPCT